MSGEGPGPRGGAPKGNTNAMKHGARSRMLRRAVDKMLSDDDIRALLRLLAALAPEEARRYQDTIVSHARTVARKRNARSPAAASNAHPSPPPPHETPVPPPID